MYNEAIKQNFLESIQNNGTKLYAKSTLDRSGAFFESEYGKDIVEMSSKEMIDGLAQMHLLNYASVRSVLSIIKRYAAWYNSNIKNISLDEIMSITATKVDLSQSLREEIIKDEAELRATMSFLSASEGYFEVPIMLLAWSGLTLKEILELKNEDVVVRGNTVFAQTGRKTTRINSDYIVDTIKEYKAVRSSTRPHRGDWEVYPDDIGYFIKNMIVKDSKFSGKRISAGNVRNRIDVYGATLPDGYKKITPDNVLLSGRLHRILESEIATGTISPEVVVNEMGIKMSLLNDYVALYNMYKKAFSIKPENIAD